MHKPVRLSCEYLSNPIGIDIIRPRLNWQNESKDYNFKQSVYQIVAYDSHDLLNSIWDSGEVKAQESIHIFYGGPSPHSRQRIYWRVRTWSDAGVESAYSALAFFEMGLLSSKDWEGKWINPDEDLDCSIQQPAAYMRKEFMLQSDIKKARLYITACGLYEASINGERIGDEVLTPGRTDYNLHQQYQTYDVTSYLKKGENAIGVILADGWYRGRLGIEGNRNVFGKERLLLCQLEIITIKDEVVRIISDEDFKVTHEGEIRKTDISDGEWVDARKKTKGFESPCYDDQSWKNVQVVQRTYATLCASNNVPIREKEQFKPKLLITPDGSTVLDFGQNIPGYVSFYAQGNAGEELNMYFGESLDENGNFTLKNILDTRRKSPNFQEFHYIYKGEGIEFYKPKFYIHGFRYVKIENWSNRLKLEDFTAHAVYSDMEDSENFKCSNPLVNKLVENVRWSQKSIFVDIPTEQKAADEPAKVIIEYDYKIGTGFLSEKGATSIWENWDCKRPDGTIHASMNHFSPGAVIEWLFRDICGLTSKSGGYKEFYIIPQIGDEFDFAKAEYESMYGKIVSEWRRKGKNVIYTFIIPANTTAYINLGKVKPKILVGMSPLTYEGDMMVFGSGKYVFEI